VDVDRDRLRVVRGDPTDEELAALVAVLRARRRVGAPAAPVSAWVRSARPGATGAGLPRERGPRVWRASALPGGR
jgi:hypothetical protein